MEREGKDWSSIERTAGKVLLQEGSRWPLGCSGLGRTGAARLGEAGGARAGC